MSEMVERVAKAMWEALRRDSENNFVTEFQGGERFDEDYEKVLARVTTLDGRFDLEAVARAAIAAMTDAISSGLVGAGVHALRMEGFGEPGEPVENLQRAVTEVFKAMIDAALK